MAVRKNRDAIAACVLSAATRTPDGKLALDQPIKRMCCCRSEDDAGREVVEPDGIEPTTS
jgi:hypothetical protein